MKSPGWTITPSSISFLPYLKPNIRFTLPFQTGSVVKYRYLRIGSASEVPEATLSEGEVRYRLFSVTAESIVTDSVQMWQDAPLAADTVTGQVTGQVTSAENGAPLSDILVSVAGLLTFTDANGHFFLDGIAPGIQNIVFYAINGALLSPSSKGQ